jgi:polyhydroxyalkanoate synthesis regulator phasin
MASEHVTGGVYTPDNAAHQHHVVHDRPDRVVRRISPWAVLAGALVGVVVMFLLGLLGLGIGLATIDPAAGGSDTPGLGTLGTGTAIWGIITFLIALFAAGWVAGRLAGDPQKLDGLLHGVVAWALTTLIVMWLMTTTVSSVIGGALSVVGNVASAAAQQVQEVARGGNLEGVASQISWQQVEQRVEQALPGDLQVDRQVLMNALQQFLMQGGDRQAVIDILTQQGGLSTQEAESLLQELESAYQQAVQEVEQQAAQAAEATASAVSSAALWSFVALLLGAAAAAGGGWLGAPRDEVATRRAAVR